MTFSWLEQRRTARRLDALEERLIWMTCSPRSGSTWLLHMLGAHPEVVRFNEPLIGLHLGLFTTDLIETPGEQVPTDRAVWHRLRAGHEEYFFAESFREAWAPHLRALLLARAGAHADRYGTSVPQGMTPVVCVKEPMGGQAADFVMGVLPKARILHLVRDPRDVVASLVDAYREGTWFSKMYPEWDLERVDRETRVRNFATQWRVRTEIGTAAHDAHPPERRLAIRYEDLRAEPVTWLGRIFEWAGLHHDDVKGIVDRMAFEKTKDVGEGQFHRKAKPGSWDESLSPEEVKLIEEECAEPMVRYGYLDIAGAPQATGALA
jgi:Sulfotransferase family